MTDEPSQPNSDEIEVSVFGPGVGESIVVYVAGKWIIVDSYLDSNSKQSAPVQYLKSLNVDLSTDVALVVVTHWHNDHIRGISSVIRESSSAKVVMSSAFRSEEVKQLVMAYGDVSNDADLGLSEVQQVFTYLRDTNRKVTLASTDKLLYASGLEGATANMAIHALSPSDTGVLRAISSLSSLLPNGGTSKKRIVSPTPNNASIALWITVDKHTLLLGADLEETSSADCGWSVILKDSTLLTTAFNRASTFKVPHHGSENAHCDDVWTQLLTDTPVSIVTPYNRGTKPLPSQNDLDRLSSLTDKVFLTASPSYRRSKFSDRMVESVVRETTKSIRSLKTDLGQVRLRKKVGDVDKAWNVALFGSANHYKAS
jgi:beta-lactamase superfamily II metal-dependent hydrolase